MKKIESDEIKEGLNKLFPNPICELNYTHNHEFLLSVMLSAQTTDKRVNEVGNYIEDVPQIGKNNCIYKHRSGICLETAYFPDAINQPNFASPILKANEIYNTKTIYKFL